MYRVQSSSDVRVPEVAYILKAFPRTSETFITNEVAWLEAGGRKLLIYSIERLEGQQKHGVFSRIASTVTYLPQADDPEDGWFSLWLCKNLHRFFIAHVQLLAMRPVKYLQTLAESMAMSSRYRANRSEPWKKVFIKQFLQAGFIALKVLRSKQIQHLHAHFAHYATTVAMFASHLSGRPFSFTAHAKDIYLRDLNPGDLLRIKMQRAAFIVTCTRSNKDFLMSIESNGAPIHVVYHGLDTELFQQDSSPRNEASRIPMILSAGRHVEKKGFTDLVAACRLLKDKGYVFRCRILGGVDKYTPAIEALIHKLSLENVVSLEGSVTQEKLRSIYMESTIFVLPCRIVENDDRDGITNMMAEAMAMDLPIISTRISGIPEIVQDRVNGLLVEQKAPTDLAHAMEQLLSDASLRTKLGTAARETICQIFDSKRNIVELENLFAIQLDRLRDGISDFGRECVTDGMPTKTE